MDEDNILSYDMFWKSSDKINDCEHLGSHEEGNKTAILNTRYLHLHFLNNEASSVNNKFQNFVSSHSNKKLTSPLHNVTITIW